MRASGDECAADGGDDLADVRVVNLVVDEQSRDALGHVHAHLFWTSRVNCSIWFGDDDRWCGDDLVRQEGGGICLPRLQVKTRRVVGERPAGVERLVQGPAAATLARVG